MLADLFAIPEQDQRINLSGFLGGINISPCRYFMQGVCREGSRCLFSHDLSTSKPSTICKFYQKGQCAYGARCRYELLEFRVEIATTLLYQ